MSEKKSQPIDVDVVLISYAKNPDLLKETITSLTSLFDSEDSNLIRFNAVVVESEKGVQYNQETKGHTLTVIYPDVEFGYHTYLNLGLEQGNAEWSCLCNNDLFFRPKWATNILNLIETQRENDPKVWEYVSASPANPRETWHYGKLGCVELGYVVRGHIAGWCLFQSRNIFDKIGKLDERIKFWFCDNWYSVVLQHFKIPHVFIGTSTVEHHNETEGTTTRDIDLSEEEKHKLTFGAGDKFREIIRELLGNDSWGRPTEAQLEALKKEGREFY